MHGHGSSGIVRRWTSQRRLQCYDSCSPYSFCFAVRIQLPFRRSGFIAKKPSWARAARWKLWATDQAKGEAAMEAVFADMRRIDG